jgi:hypothetical protein
MADKLCAVFVKRLKSLRIRHIQKRALTTHAFMIFLPKAREAIIAKGEEQTTLQIPVFYKAGHASRALQVPVIGPKL